MRITERQQMPDGSIKEWPSNYRFTGIDRRGRYIFREDGLTPEYFVKRPDGVAGWHLRCDGVSSFEFVSTTRGG